MNIAIAIVSFIAAVERAVRKQVAKGITWMRTVRFSDGTIGSINFTLFPDGSKLIKAKNRATIKLYPRRGGFGSRVGFNPDSSMASMAFGPDERKLYKAAVKAAGY